MGESLYNVQHIVKYFQACSNSAYSMHSGERYRTIGPLVIIIIINSPNSLNIFASGTTGPIKVKFHTKLLWDGGMKV